MKLLVILFYLYIFTLPFIGLFQVINGIVGYYKKEKPADYYKDLERYGMIVIGYFGIWFLSSLMPTKWFHHEGTSVIALFYIFAIPACIAYYHCRIMNKERYEEIEELIF